MRVQNICNAAKAVLRGKQIAIQACLKKEENSQMHNPTLHLKDLEKEQQIKLKSSRREIVHIRAEINDTETREKVERTTKSELVP